MLNILRPRSYIYCLGASLTYRSAKISAWAIQRALEPFALYESVISALLLDFNIIALAQSIFQPASNTAHFMLLYDDAYHFIRQTSLTIWAASRRYYFTLTLPFAQCYADATARNIMLLDSDAHMSFRRALAAFVIITFIFIYERRVAIMGHTLFVTQRRRRHIVDWDEMTRRRV